MFAHHLTQVKTESELKVLRPTQHKTGYFGHILPSLRTEETKPNTKILQHNINTKLKPGLGASYKLWPGNGAGAVLQLLGPTWDTSEKSWPTED